MIVDPAGGRTVALGGMPTTFRLTAADTGGAIGLVEHRLAPRALGSPVHTHGRELEVSHVLEGEIGVLVGDRELRAGPGATVLKPRGVPHAFWNAADTPARVLEMIVPGGFEAYFAQLDELLRGGLPPDEVALAALCRAYGLEMDLASVPELVRRHSLVLG